MDTAPLIHGQPYNFFLAAYTDGDTHYPKAKVRRVFLSQRPGSGNMLVLFQYNREVFGSGQADVFHPVYEEILADRILSITTLEGEQIWTSK